MKTQTTSPQQNQPHSRLASAHLKNLLAVAAVVAGCCALSAQAATVNVFTNSFDTFTDVATSLTDNANANPPAAFGPNTVTVESDRANATPLAIGSFGGNGVQVINWDSASAPNSILLRPGAIIHCNFHPRSGTNYTLEWKMKTKKSTTSNRGFRISLRSQGADINADGTDFVIWRTMQTETTNAVAGNSGIEGVDYFQSYNGIAGTPGSVNWVTMTNAGTGLREGIPNNVWQSYKVVADSVGRTWALYINGALVNGTNYCARQADMIPAAIRFENEGANNKDYFLVDDINLTVDGNLVDLNSPIVEGFESYPARTSPTDDADPQGPWVVAEVVGTGAGALADLTKVQVVDSSVTAPRSGTKSLKLEGGQIAGASVAWGATPQTDVKITWWQKVPSTSAGNTMYLRVSVYGWETRTSAASDSLLFGSGHRSSAPTGTTDSLFGFNRMMASGNGAWLDSLATYTADTWEEYQLTTDLKHNTYTIVKNPSSTPVVIVADYPFIASVPVQNMHTIGFSSSNGSGHPPVYIDDITIESFENTAPAPARPYTPTITGTRFTNYTVLTVPSHVVGGVAVDPRDNSILFATDEWDISSIWRAQKVASGNWVLDAAPIVTGLDRPTALTVETNGTIWWVHSQIQSVRRLKEPWASSVIEEVVSDFATTNNVSDQPVGLTFMVTNGVSMLAVLDRRNDNVANRNAITLVDPTSTSLNQVGYTNYLVPPSTSALSGGPTYPASAIATLSVSNEVVTTVLNDGWISAVNSSGAIRYIPTTAAAITDVRGIAVDPTDNRIWIVGNDPTTPDLAKTAQIWSFDSDTGASSAQEITFPRVGGGTADRPDRRIVLHEGGMAFSTNGNFLVVGDASFLSGGGRLVIFHSEPFVIAPVSITSVTRSGGNVDLTWTSGGGVNYVVQRSTTVDGTYTTISPVLTSTQYTDAGSPADNAFYRVLAYQQN